MEEKLSRELNRVYRFLSFRPRSHKEIFDYLKKIKIPPQRTSQIIKVLKRKRLVDDREFVRWWIEQRVSFKPKGRIALEKELKQKGIEESIIKEALDELNEIDLAKRALQLKFKSLNTLTGKELFQKMFSFLMSRGFSQSTIREVVASFKKGEFYKNDENFRE